MTELTTPFDSALDRVNEATTNLTRLTTTLGKPRNLTTSEALAAVQAQGTLAVASALLALVETLRSQP